MDTPIYFYQVQSKQFTMEDNNSLIHYISRVVKKYYKKIVFQIHKNFFYFLTKYFSISLLHSIYELYGSKYLKMFFNSLKYSKIFQFLC